MGKTLLGLFIAGALLLGIFATTGYVQYSNKEIILANQIMASQKVMQITSDNMWKVISQQFQVSDTYKSSFKEIFIGITQKKFENNNQVMFSWLQEHTPTFDPSLFKQLMNTVDSKRVEFVAEETKCISLQNEHLNLLQTWPGSWFLFNRHPVPIILITSDRTNKAFETGKEDEICLNCKK